MRVTSLMSEGKCDQALPVTAKAISPSIGVERYTPCGRPQGPSRPEYRAQYPDARPFVSECSLKVRRLLREQDQAGAFPAALSIFRDANTGAGQDFTGLAAAVQLRLRVAIGLQALQRCSGLLNRRARGSTVATHNFGGGTRIEKFMRSLACPARRIELLPSASSSVSTLS